MSVLGTNKGEDSGFGSSLRKIMRRDVPKVIKIGVTVLRSALQSLTLPITYTKLLRDLHIHVVNMQGNCNFTVGYSVSLWRMCTKRSIFYMEGSTEVVLCKS